jgi:hypothetical protein
MAEFERYGHLDWDPVAETAFMQYPDGERVPISSGKKELFVDGTNGDDDNSGYSEGYAFANVQAAVDKADPNTRIWIKPKEIPAGATDPVSYEEPIIIPAGLSGITLIGYPGARAQGGLPQIKLGSGAIAQIIVRAPGFTIKGIGINGGGATGGGILLDDDAVTKSAFGAAIIGCHFKNCAGSSATDARTGGAIQWAATAEGAAWQVLIRGNRFYKNVGDIVSLATAGLVPQDVVIEDNLFSGPAANVDCNIYAVGGGSGMNGIAINRNIFPALPNIGSGSVKRFIDATGCVGELVDNYFGDTTTATGYGAAKAKAKIPTTMFMMHNYNESGLITREA